MRAAGITFRGLSLPQRRIRMDLLSGGSWVYPKAGLVDVHSCNVLAMIPAKAGDQRGKRTDGGDGHHRSERNRAAKEPRHTSEEDPAARRQRCRRTCW